MSKPGARRKQQQPAKVVASRRRAPRRLFWLALAAALMVGGGAYWYFQHEPANPGASEPEPMSAEERSLRDEARRHPADPTAQDALGLYLLEQRRPYEAMWAFQDLLDLRPADPYACRGLARSLIVTSVT